MSVRELATCPARTCPATASVEGAARLMAEADIGFLCVVDDHGKPVGVLTDRDIVVRAVARHALGELTVADVMTRHPASVGEAATVGAAAKVMSERRCRRIIVTGDDGKVVGVLSLDDLLREAGDELQHVGRAVRGAVAAHDIIP